ncbi:BCCT family transporter [Treponema sp. TIM-1]|uniref:BCCT family transporter n=1 Tax=Treponema sp. TIM-1 TaxID=2898417 RepID=UPI0039800E01
MEQHAGKPHIDWMITIPSLLILGGICVLFLALNTEDNALLNSFFAFVTGAFGGVFHFYIFGVLILLCYISFSKIGSIRLGEGPPQYATFSWVSMLFCACIGSSILYWGLIEWAYYMGSPPFNLEPGSREAAEYSVTYTLYHWGVSGWATYSVAAVIIAFYHFTKKVPNLRISVSCGFTGQNSLLGNVVDIFVIIGLITGVAVSIALGTPLIAQGLHHIFGIDTGIYTNIIIAVFWACLFGTSAVSGIDRGIKILSNVNTVIALGFITYVLVAGGRAVFIGNNAVNSFGLMVQNYLYMSFYTDPIGKSGFPQAWTIFYWGWWLSYVPVMGLFIAKISRGRTIRQVILGGVLLGSLGCWFFLAILGGYGLDLQLSGVLDTVKNLREGGDYAAIMALLDSLPFANIAHVVFIIVAFIFLATTCDSSAYILASISTKNITASMNPSKRSRIMWTLSLIILPIVLMVVGGLNTVKLCTVLGSIPIIFILTAMVWNFMKDAREISRRA